MTCAIVDAYGAGRLLPAALRRRHIEFVHVRSQHPDTRLVYRPEDFAIDIQHTGDVRATAAALRGVGVSSVVAAAESGVLLADELCVALNVPGNAIDRTLARRDKFAMQEVVRAAGLPTAQNLQSTSAADTVEWVRGQRRWPVVLKPALSAGTDNVIICNSVDEVTAAHDRIMCSVDRYGRRNNVVLAQQYLHGSEHYVNTVSRDGEHRVVEVWRYRKHTVNGRSVYDYDDLLSLDDDGASDIVDYVLQVLNALGIANGAAHTEVMLTPDGPYLIESGARLGGGQMPELLTRCVGSDQVDNLAFSIADPEGFKAEIAAPYRRSSHLRCVNLISPGDGAIPFADRWQPIRDLPSFAGLVVNHPEGVPVSRTVDMATCPGTVYLNTADPSELESDYLALRDIERNGLYR
ncbi:MAG: hypothetical protein QOE97_1829 [Pseudonocardiales bacterium]|jgi:biotin carboxylase|nr:hypothetical protein [Pseudonocardiales bacterium]